MGRTQPQSLAEAHGGAYVAAIQQGRLLAAHYVATASAQAVFDMQHAMYLEALAQELRHVSWPEQHPVNIAAGRHDGFIGYLVERAMARPA